jgi:tetratricopeptide (TPR) repeat protein
MRIKFALLVFVGLSAGVLAPARVAWAADTATEEAKQHFLKGQQLFDVGRWDEAAEAFEKAYSMKGDPTFIYNMAQAYRRKGDAKRALDLYKNYLIKAPKAAQRPEVEERIRVLQKQVEETDYQTRSAAQNAPAPVVVPPPAPSPAPAAPAPTPVAAPAPAPAPAPSAAPTAVNPSAAPLPAAPSDGYPGQPSVVQAEAAPPPVAAPGRGLRVAGVVLGISGVALVGAGIFFGAEAKSYSDRVETASLFNPNFEDRGKLYETLQWVGYGVGAGLVATGAVLYGLGVVAAKSPAVALAPTVFPGGAGLSAQGVF